MGRRNSSPTFSYASVKATFAGSEPMRKGRRAAGRPASRRVASAPIARSASACS